MIIAGLGCRRSCPAEEIVALLRRAAALATAPSALAAPAFKRREAGLLEAAERLGLPLLFIDAEAMAAAQAGCITRSDAAWRATGLASVAEAAALAGGGRLMLPRIASAWATCAIAARP